MIFLTRSRTMQNAKDGFVWLEEPLVYGGRPHWTLLWMLLAVSALCLKWKFC